MGIQATLRHQFSGSTHLTDLAIIQNNNLISICHRPHTMGNHHDRLILQQHRQGILYQCFTLGIHRSSCFIKQDNRSIFQQSAGNRNALTLAARQGAAVFPDVRLIPLGQALDKFLALGGFGRSHHFLIGGIAPAQPDILHDSLIKEHDILKYNGIVLEQRFRF